MILSKENLLSSNQAITATARSTNVIDLGVNGTPYGNAQPIPRDPAANIVIPFFIQVSEAFATATSVTFTLQTSDLSDFSSGNIDHWTSGAIAIAALKAGWRAALTQLPPAAAGAFYKRYLSVLYTVAGSNATAGKVNAGIAAGVPVHVI